jgi:hypothetical protein
MRCKRNTTRWPHLESCSYADALHTYSIHRRHCNDDHVSLNTQSSTQWDGFRHYPYQNYPTEGSFTYFGGMSSDDAKDKTVTKYGIQSTRCVSLACRGPVPGRNRRCTDATQTTLASPSPPEHTCSTSRSTSNVTVCRQSPISTRRRPSP